MCTRTCVYVHECVYVCVLACMCVCLLCVVLGNISIFHEYRIYTFHQTIYRIVGIFDIKILYANIYYVKDEYNGSL